MLWFFNGSPAKENVFKRQINFQNVRFSLIEVFADEKEHFELSHLNAHDDRMIRADKLRSCDCYVTASSEKLFFS